MATNPAPILSNSYGPEVVVPPSDLEPLETQEARQADPLLEEGMTKSELVPSVPTVPSNKRGNSLRLSSLGLALLVFAATAIVLGAGVGGGLGAKLASCQNQLQR